MYIEKLKRGYAFITAVLLAFSVVSRPAELLLNTYAAESDGDDGSADSDEADSPTEPDGEDSSTESGGTDGSADSVRINGGSYGKRIGAVVNETIDIKDGLTKFRPVYHDESNITYKISTSFSNITITEVNGVEYTLSPDECSTLTKIFEFLMNELNFSEAMAAGVCGNLYQECHFKVDIGSEGSSGAYGIVQWMGGRKTALKNYASKNGGKISDLDIQLGYLKEELQSTYIYNLAHINSYLAKYASTKDGKTVDVTNIDDVDMATDAWCVVFEGCACYRSDGTLYDDDTHGDECGIAANGKSFQSLVTRKRYANSFYSQRSVVSGGGDVAIGGDFAGMSNAEILTKIFGYPDIKSVQSRMTLSQVKAKYCTGSFTLKNKDGSTVSISGVNKYVTDSLKAAMEEVIATGFKFDGTTYVYRVAENTSSKGNWSFHNVGLALDINCASDQKTGKWLHNPQFYLVPNKYKLPYYTTSAQIATIYDPVGDPLAMTSKEANIFKSHGWLWGRDFSTRPDIMHMTVGEVGQDGKNKWISDELESGNLKR